MAKKTEDELKEEWGIERLVEAYSILCGWAVNRKGLPTTKEQMLSLQKESDDAFELFLNRAYWYSQESNPTFP